MFSALGSVFDEQNHPMADVKVTLRISNIVYKAITPLESDVRNTNELGEFNFQYISGSLDPPYSLTFEKDGFEKQVIGNATQNMNPFHVILKRSR